jgi:hypothetical protein
LLPVLDRLRAPAERPEAEQGGRGGRRGGHRGRLIALTPEAAAQIDALERFTVEKARPRALRNLGHALTEAGLVVANAPERGLWEPQPYPSLVAFGWS